MQFKLTESACVAKGTFNIYIFQPNWVGEVMECKLDEDVEFSADFDKPGFRISFASSSTSWTVRPDAVIISSNDGSTSCGELIGKVLDHLPVTPMQAVGNNFAFKSDGNLADLPSRSEFAWLKTEANGIETKHRSLAFSVEREGAKFNAGMQCDSNGEIVTHVNVHRDSLNAEAASTSAKMFDQDLNTARELIRELFGLEL